MKNLTNRKTFSQLAKQDVSLNEASTMKDHEKKIYSKVFSSPVRKAFLKSGKNLAEYVESMGYSKKEAFEYIVKELETMLDL